MMSITSATRLGGFWNFFLGLLLLIWWFSMGIFLPIAEAAENFNLVVSHKNWVSINIIGLFGTIVWIISFSSFYRYKILVYSIKGYLGYLIGLSGIVLFSCIQYYETFVWPVVVKHNPHLIQTIDSPLLFGDNLLIYPLILSGVCVGIGYILVGIDVYQRKVYPAWLLVLKIIGALIFANGLVFIIRTLGVILFSLALLFMGWRMLKLK